MQGGHTVYPVCLTLSVACVSALPSLFYFFVFLSFLVPHPRHMEVPRIGVQLELQLLAYARATATWDPSCVYTTAHSNAGSVTH